MLVLCNEMRYRRRDSPRPWVKARTSRERCSQQFRSNALACLRLKPQDKFRQYSCQHRTGEEIAPRMSACKTQLNQRASCRHLDPILLSGVLAAASSFSAFVLDGRNGGRGQMSRLRSSAAVRITGDSAVSRLFDMIRSPCVRHQVPHAQSPPVQAIMSAHSECGAYRWFEKAVHHSRTSVDWAGEAREVMN